jgi:hypothetical protein
VPRRNQRPARPAFCAIPCAAISAAVIGALAMFFVIAYWDQRLLGSIFNFGRYEYRALLI